MNPSHRRHGVRAALVALAFVVVAGQVELFTTWRLFHEFLSDGMVPRVVALAVVRMHAAMYAAGVSCLLVTGYLHEGGWGAAARPRIATGKLALLSALAVFPGYPLVAVLELGSAMLTGCFLLGLSPGSFLDFTRGEDLVFAMKVCALLAVVPAAWSFLAHRFLSPRHWRLRVELLATFAFLAPLLVVPWWNLLVPATSR